MCLRDWNWTDQQIQNILNTYIYEETKRMMNLNLEHDFFFPIPRLNFYDYNMKLYR